MQQQQWCRHGMPKNKNEEPAHMMTSQHQHWPAAASFWTCTGLGSGGGSAALAAHGDCNAMGTTFQPQVTWTTG